ncbi:ribokinase [Reyranella soli]|uniref:ribokinase n=1 Tax=Reyranella soli TaxID=1230389 RepID=UPI002482E304|nr:ribokinase [Reyranella soli]
MPGRVVVIGNAGLDLRLTVPRLPLPGETLIGSSGAWAPGGKGLNQAVVAARCGAPVCFCAPLGHDDGQADDIERHLKAAGIAELILPRLAHATDFSLLMVLPNGENSIVSTSACSLAMRPAHVKAALRDLLPRDVVLLQGNLPLDTTSYILDTVRRQGATSIFNPAPFWPGAENLVAHCSLVIANRVEAEQLGNAIHDAKAAIVTLGAEGCVLTEGGRRRSFPAQAVQAIDSTGCGDAFCGVVVAALVQGLSMDAAIAAAQKAAALTATRPGAFEALPSNEELQAILAA